MRFATLTPLSNLQDLGPVPKGVSGAKTNLNSLSFMVDYSRIR